ncbi:MAG: alcohol dehydrogenase family protein [Pseudomonadota bacterium]
MSNLPEKMSGVLLTGHGGFEKLEYRDDINVPELGHGDVLIRVRAAAVNNTDLNTRKGWYSKGDGDAADASWSGNALKFPFVQGADVCGEIAAVGNGVDANRISERVIIEPCLHEVDGRTVDPPWYFGSECNGGFAQYTKVAARYAHTIDTDLSNVELASFPCSYSTAENMLTRAGLTSNERVLVTGASGGVGSAAIQLAKARGAEVVAVTSASKAEAIRQIGADDILDRDDDLLEILGRNSIDVVADLVAGPQWPALLDILRPGGRYTVSGAIAGPIVELDVRTLYLKDLSFFGCTVLEPVVFPNLVRLIETARIMPLVAETFPLAEIVSAQTAFEKKAHIGKIVLEVN